MMLTYKNIDTEFPEIAAIHAQSFAGEWSEKTLLDMFDKGQYSGSLLLTDGQVIGFIICAVVLDEAEIISIAISPQERGKTHAAQLLSFEINRLVNLNITKLYLEVNEANIAAIKLYKGQNFSQTAVRKNYYKLTNGQRANALVFSLNLGKCLT
ncbi:MAG: ribosomal-protein-alanine N-acetyltransferase [Hyphomicrobiales bacterium]|nr:MAG: ribosomal-protein-alanine N-acetyltransferase [Hyphomicrobiales bacterium]